MWNADTSAVINKGIIVLNYQIFVFKIQLLSYISPFSALCRIGICIFYDFDKKSINKLASNKMRSVGSHMEQPVLFLGCYLLNTWRRVTLCWLRQSLSDHSGGVWLECQTCYKGAALSASPETDNRAAGRALYHRLSQGRMVWWKNLEHYVMNRIINFVRKVNYL